MVSIHFNLWIFIDETEAWLAPGYYEHQNSFIDNKAKNKKKANTFLTTSERFEVQKVKDTPGPGHYTNEANAAQWFKRSFNMIFTE
jgi:hypothetical protein